MTCLFLALTLVVANAQSIISIKLCRYPEHVGVALRGRIARLPTVRLLPVVTRPGERTAQLLETRLPQIILNPRPVLPVKHAVLPALQKLMRNR